MSVLSYIVRDQRNGRRFSKWPKSSGELPLARHHAAGFWSCIDGSRSNSSPTLALRVRRGDQPRKSLNLAADDCRVERFPRNAVPEVSVQMPCVAVDEVVTSPIFMRNRCTPDRGGNGWPVESIHRRSSSEIGHQIGRYLFCWLQLRWPSVPNVIGPMPTKCPCGHFECHTTKPSQHTQKKTTRARCVLVFSPITCHTTSNPASRPVIQSA